MNTAQIINEMLKEIEPLKDIDRLNGGELSEKAVRLASYKVSIGQALVKMEHELNMTEAARKQEWNTIYSNSRKSDMKVADAEMEADSGIREIALEEIELKRKVGVLKNLRHDADTVITTMQSRMSQLKSEMVESRS